MCTRSRSATGRSTSSLRKLVDIDDSMATWRHKHVVTVERIIGFKRGTGGHAGRPLSPVDRLEARLSQSSGR
jgi:tryptophan 2,3-dioxygenase